MTTRILRHASVSAGILTAFAVVGTALLAATYLVTRPIIAETEKQAKLALIGQILPATLYDNDLLKDAALLPPAKELGNSEPTTVYRAVKEGKPSAAVLEVIAPDGYSGKIRMIVAIKADGEISGVRVVTHHETPGLGDYIEIAKNRWIRIFEGKSLSKYANQDWKVKKDGGKFEHTAGATVSPRAVVKAVHKSLEYFAQNEDKIFSLPADKQEQAK
ncbi:MAG: electron transporter RnfG [Betaproteobacteria bacterium CG2_30_59_46]|nr:MAG: electron transporter RnfG [Betaproteobacteria bacterium CG2_30_59_46]PIQ13733.1 MAG: electron transport complex subunit RsxG [Hydrogenophilales bacterium CG18_big_fil_WC_8_21_14_2_50_58_12]PIY01072.1 MAG: electron transport complex subunit RsxG [Hydrogenophilales bacterium CG_4_10_14_3_um_filter_58_23]PJB04662.1 MAG: electron transport complex subunit RsxG [Hydrogenophilales bacterium CG_4_9_14_3_um_filter_59_35]